MALAMLTNTSGTWILEASDRRRIDKAERPMTSVPSIWPAGDAVGIRSVFAQWFARLDHDLAVAVHGWTRKESSTNAKD